MLRSGTAKIDLAKIPLFDGVDDAVTAGKVEDWLFFCHDGQKVCVQGEPADNMIVILRGEIQILSEDMSMVTRRAPDVWESRVSCRAMLAARPMQLPGAP